MPAYWQTIEWWTDGDPPHYRRGITELNDAYPEVAPTTWAYRRRQAIQRFPELEWLNLARGFHNQRVADVAHAAPDTLPPDLAATVVHDSEVHRLTSKVKVLEAKYAEALKESEVEERILTALSDKVPLLPPVPAPTFSPRNPGRPETVCALFSDWHIGEVVSHDETGGLAHYDFDTYSRRLQYLIDGVGGVCFGKLTGYDFPELRIFFLGDMVTGIIHDELVESAEGTVMEWLIDGAHLAAQGVRQLAAEFPTVVCDCVIGNHGRLQKQVRYKKRYVNWDYLFYHFLALALKDLEHVTFDIHKSFFSVVEVANHRVLNLHGDNVKSWAGIPWYGIQRAIGNLTGLLASQRTYFDYVNLGHFHNAGSLDRVRGEIVLNGSMVGGNEFSIGALFTSSQPKQVIYGMHPERGKTWEYKLDLSNGDAHESRFAV